MLHFRKGQLKNIIIIITFAILLAFVAFNFKDLWGAVLALLSFVSPVLYGLAIAYVLNILMRVLEERVFFFMKRSKRKFVRKMLRPLALVLTLLIFLGTITILIAVVWPNLEETVTSLFAKLPGYFNEFKDWALELLDTYHFDAEWLENLNIDWKTVTNTVLGIFTSDTTSNIIGGAASAAGSLTSGVMNTVFSFVIAVYFLAQKERICAFVTRVCRAFLPRKFCEKLFHVSRISDSVFSNFLRGQCTEAIIFAVLCYIGLKIFAFPYAEIISVVLGITALVPIIGALVGEIFGAILILTVSPWRALLFLIFVLILQQIEGSLIYPRVVGTSIGLPGILVFSAVIIGGNVGGVLNAFLSVPICAVVYTLLREEMEKRASVKESVPADTPQDTPPAK